MVLARKEYRAEIRRRIGLAALVWELAVGLTVFVVVWLFGAMRDGTLDWPELEDFGVGGIVVLVMEGWRQFIGRRQAAYDMYREEAARADSAEAQAQKLKETRAYANWYDVSGRFLSLREYGINAHRIVYAENGTDREEWELDGASEPHKRSFRAVCELAGDTLAISKVWTQLPPEVKEENNLFVRWLRYVAHIEGMKESITGDQWKDGVLVHEYRSWCFDDLPMASKRLSQDCSLREMVVNS